MAGNLPEKKQDERELKYQLENGREIKLTFEMVRKYLIRGKTEAVTLQELVVFMKKCESMQWDPFKDDVYIIKYSANDSAQIVQAIGSKRSKAMQANNCQGWKAGICYIDPDGEYCEREGEILLDGETLVGGWFEARPANWNAPYKHTVNLAPYAKNNQFWSKDKQPHMIRKVAESQGLSALWRDYVGDTYMEGERYADEPISLSRSADGDYAAAPKIDELKKAVNKEPESPEIIHDKVGVPARKHDCDKDGCRPEQNDGEFRCRFCGKEFDPPYTAPEDPMRLDGNGNGV